MLTEQQLTTLAQAMTGSSPVSRFIDVGYTYLGQFIAHDIVPQTNPIPGQSCDVLPYLHMDSIYGSGARTAKLLDERGLFPMKLQEQRRRFANAAFTDRTFCMRHVIELVLGNN